MLIVEGSGKHILTPNYHCDNQLRVIIRQEYSEHQVDNVVRLLKQFPTLLFFKSPKLTYFHNISRNFVSADSMEELIAAIAKIMDSSNDFWLLSMFTYKYAYRSVADTAVDQYEAVIIPLTDLLAHQLVRSAIRYYAVTDILTDLS